MTTIGQLVNKALEIKRDKELRFEIEKLKEKIKSSSKANREKVRRTLKKILKHDLF